MRTRFITALIGVAVLLPILFLSHTWVLPIAAAFFAVMGTFEMMRCLGVHKNLVATIPLYLISAAMPAVARLMDSIPSFGSMALFILMAYFFYLMAVTLLSGGVLTFGKSAEIFASGTYITLAFSAIVMVRDFNETGRYIYLLIFIAAWITDIFAYLCGRLFGRHKLIPAVSPHKTVEGSVGGILFCIIACVVFGAVTAALTQAEPNYLFLGVSGLLLSVCSQIGDLIASLIKREHGIKDYGKLFPGHGGVMDRFDSIAAVALVMLMLCALPQLGFFYA
ncbi:MAG: hypothetical protein E7654_00820 [Ruminococcaceae bacterium]|nr:hypothetical protein [Oscillospiraceae bacterium]